MKGIKKYLFIMAALAAVFGFVACSDEDDDPSVVAVYKATDDGATLTITFLDDDTWSLVGETEGQKATGAEGTYTGDPSKDTSTSNIVTITIKKFADDEDGKLVDATTEFPTPIPVLIINGKANVMGAVYTRQ